MDCQLLTVLVKRSAFTPPLVELSISEPREYSVRAGEGNENMTAYRCSQLHIARSTSPDDAPTFILALASQALVLSRQQALVSLHPSAYYGHKGSTTVS
jgi:hypothetical protein